MTENTDNFDIDQMFENAQNAASFLKTMAHQGRLMILCHLVNGEKTVTELENLLSLRQAAISQQLARLRAEGFVTYRREGKTIFYSMKDDKALKLIDLLYNEFCKQDQSG